MKNLVKILLCLFCITFIAIPGYAEESLQPLTVQLGWFPAANCAGILIAKDRGWYKESGIDLTVRPWKPGVFTPDEVAGGKAQIGIAAGSLLIKAITDGTPVRAIAAQFQKSPLCIISKKEKSIRTPAQLAGKRVGFGPPKTKLMAKIVLASQGLDFNDITVAEAGGDLRFLIEDRVDAMSGFINNQPLTMKELGYEVNCIPAFKYGYDFYSKVFFATDEMIRKQPEQIRKFLDVTFRGWREVFEDPAAAARLIVSNYNSKVSVQQQTESLKTYQYLAFSGVGEDLIGFMEERVWQKGIDTLYKFQVTDRKIPVDKFFTLAFLKNR
ncbi:hypothetical protein DENIS_1864 [Desulfonema ishimotonii]|uniref:Thiamine pyrimidine synthase n=1 Tax=Desulfonema ishimotonii TaxID=45657 RepID=A0A401FVD0_9BACT|nr:ABC transporter substrate-binding protein [Desulfonema ishimotonii]GBC60904.1 hypothetical protein DENIS_1864 [Desulfonema ishimotonii]